MILTDLQTYVAEHTQVALIDLENHFYMNADVLRAMLQKLIRKGIVRKLEIKNVAFVKIAIQIIWNCISG